MSNWCIFILFLKEIFNMEVFFFFSCLKTYSELILSIYSLTYSELYIYSLTYSELSIIKVVSVVNNYFHYKLFHTKSSMFTCTRKRADIYQARSVNQNCLFIVWHFQNCPFMVWHIQNYLFMVWHIQNYLFIVWHIQNDLFIDWHIQNSCTRKRADIYQARSVNIMVTYDWIKYFDTL
jgi:hypothetical protein